MSNKLFRLSFLLAFSILFLQSSAKENIGQPQRKELSGRVDAANCSPASSQVDLNINNVRARILNGGDMWWDLVNTAKYEVPKVTPPTPPANSMFASSIWIGGIDENNQLKVSAQTYRQNGNDYFPGPLDGIGGTTTSDICTQFDHQWQVLGAEIDEFKANVLANGGTLDPSLIPSDILQWPATGNPYNPIVGSRNLAPFYDADGNGIYDPATGDYPTLGLCDPTIYADQMIWWVYNDNGNIHTESGGLPIGMEVHALAFAFRSSNEINDMTFYSYQLLNKSSNTLNKCFMGQWADPDLGNYADDYIGSDSVKGLGIVYNGEPIDPPGGSGGFYGNQPPVECIDYFQGPFDQNGNRLKMTNFLYYNNDFTVNGNPQKTSDYYGYLSGKWPDGTPFTFGGTGYGGSVPTHFVFSSPPSTTTGWSECSSHDVGGDRRMIQSSGPFILLPGASNNVIIGVVWVRPPVGTYNPCPTFDLLFQADQTAKSLFTNCFKTLTGPPPPTVRIVELDKKLVLAIEKYDQTEAYSQADFNAPNPIYRFEGYQVYQVKSSSVSFSQLNDPTQAELIFQCDIKNGVTQLINSPFDANTGANVPSVMVNGADKGIQHTFEITTDAFSTGTSSNLVNLKTYYFVVLPYAYNIYTDSTITNYLYQQTITNGNTTYVQIPQYKITTQQIEYLPSKLVNVSSGIPHVTEPEFGGLVLQADYGDGPQITRQEGRGNGGLSVNLTSQSITDILNNGFSATPTYVGGQGPVSVKVYDPKMVPNANFQIVFRDSTLFNHKKKYIIRKDTTVRVIKNKDTTYVDSNLIISYNPAKNYSDTTKYGDTSLTIVVNTKPGTILDDTATWTLQMMDGDSVVSSQNISAGEEQPIPDWGLSVYIQQVSNPTNASTVNSVINWSITYAEPYKTWLSGVADVDNSADFNWIWSGTFHVETPMNDIHSDWSNNATTNPIYDDPIEQFENIFNRQIAPYRLCSTDLYDGPAWSNLSGRTTNIIDSLPSIDLVFTPDKSKWSRCVVIETGPEVNLSEGNVPKMAVRRGQSVDQDGNPENPGDPTDLGMGWFPGYAIDPETGIRLNVFFGEDSWQIGANGRDMIWNPTSSIEDNNGEISFGGRHWIYVMRTQYDGCAFVKSQLLLPFPNPALLPANAGVPVYKNVAWVSQAMLSPGFSFLPIEQGLIPTETTLKIRINHAYSRYAPVGGTVENNAVPRYTFNTSNIAARKEDLAAAVSALDTIKVVPNPYYSYSGYESTKVDTRVRIANLPIKCTITIYSLDGTLIRKYTRDDNSSTFLDWDLKNAAGITIASGMYLVHVDAPGIGEKTIKWFGVLRPIDLDSF